MFVKTLCLQRKKRPDSPPATSCVDYVIDAEELLLPHCKGKASHLERRVKMADKLSPSQELHVDSESDDEEVVETSPCGRWEKHRKEVSIICTAWWSHRF